MGDFATWATAAGPAFGWCDGEFMAAYDANASEAATAALETSFLGEMVLELIAGEPWYGEPGDLLVRLTDVAGDRVRDRKRQWPKSAAGLGKALRRLAPSPRKAGVHVEVGREDGGDRRRFISLGRRDGLGTVRDGGKAQ